MIKFFLKDSFIYTIPALASGILSVFLIPLYTRILSPEEYGSFDLMLIFSTLVGLVVAMEITQGLARHYAVEDNCERKIDYASTAFWFTNIAYLIFVVITLLLSEELVVLIVDDKRYLSVFHVAIIYIWLNGLYLFVLNQLRWELKSKKYAITHVLVTLLSALLSVCFILMYDLKLIGIFAGMALGTLIGTIYGLWNIR